MFSASGQASGDQRGMVQSGNLRPWLHNDLKTAHLLTSNNGMGLNRAYRQTRTSLGYLDQTRTMGFPSQESLDLPGRDRKRTDTRGRVSNGLGLGRLPVQLQQEPPLERECKGESKPVWWSRDQPGPERAQVNGLEQKSAQLSPESLGRCSRLGPSSTSVLDHHTESPFVGNQAPHPRVSPPQTETGRKSSLPPPTASPKGQGDGSVPGVKVWSSVGGRGCQREANNTWASSGQRENHHPSWSRTDAGLCSSSSTSDLAREQEERGAQGLRGWRGRPESKKQPVECHNGLSYLHGAIFRTEVPQKDSGAAAPVRKTQEFSVPRPSSGHSSQPRRPASEAGGGGGDQGPRTEAGPGATRCTRKAVRAQIKRVLDNLEHVLGGLKDVHQEMGEVVRQIEYLTSSIDLSSAEEEEERAASVSPGSISSSSSGVAVERDPGQGATQGATDHLDGPRRAPPPALHRVTPKVSPALQPTPRRGGPPLVCPQEESGAPSPEPSEQRSPVRPPTPGISAVNPQHHPPPPPQPLPSPGPSLVRHHRSPGPHLGHPPLPPPHVSLPPLPPSNSFSVPPLSPSQPAVSSLSSSASPLHPRPRIRALSVIIKDHPGSTSTAHGVRPSARPHAPAPPSLSPSSSADSDLHPGPDGHPLNPTSSTPPTSAVGLLQIAPPPPEPVPLAPPPPRRGPRGRKPPPYPHNGLQQRGRRGKEPRREAPPYPVKRQLLSTTV